jgi:predicted metal-binding membrane protein
MTDACADPEPEKLPMPAEGSRLTAAFIATKLRDVGLGCEVVNLEPVGTVVLKRDRIIVVLAVAFLTASAWSYLLWLSTDMGMGGMDMTGLRMIPSGMGLMMPADMPWQAVEFAFVFAMWTVMMVGMMTPSAAPMFLMYARIGRQAEAQSRPLAATVWFAIGYFLVWIVFSLFATLVQYALEPSALLDFTMATTSNMLGGFVFVVAGLMRHGGYRRDAWGSIILGLRHGAYCVGCCWALMALLLVGGVMNVLWIVLLALLAFLERVTSMGRLLPRLTGIVLIAGGAWLFSMGMA